MLNPLQKEEEDAEGDAIPTTEKDSTEEIEEADRLPTSSASAAKGDYKSASKFVIFFNTRGRHSFSAFRCVQDGMVVWRKEEEGRKGKEGSTDRYLSPGMFMSSATCWLEST